MDGEAGHLPFTHDKLPRRRRLGLCTRLLHTILASNRSSHLDELDLDLPSATRDDSFRCFDREYSLIKQEPGVELIESLIWYVELLPPETRESDSSFRMASVTADVFDSEGSPVTIVSCRCFVV